MTKAVEHRSRPKVLILWANEYSSNLGVQALAAGTERLIEEVLGSIEITHASYGSGRLKNLDFTARNIGLAMVGANSDFVTWIRGYDLVVDTGAGDSFADIYGMRRLLEMSCLRIIVRREKIALVLGPQTIGPFESRAGKWIARLSVGSDSLVVARDRASFDVAKKMLNCQVFSATDVAFLLPEEPSSKRVGVLFNVSGLLWEKNPHVDYKFYREQVVQLCELAQSSGRGLTLISHVLDSSHADNDIDAVNECQNLLSSAPEVFHPKDLTDIRKKIASAEIVVASRMHAVLNSLSQGVPAIGWSYSRKFAPLLNDLGWNHNFDLKAQDKTLAEKTNSLLNNSTVLASEAKTIRVNARARTSLLSDELKRAVN
jgi:colanic acid/amylovoran biosynthesis protein